MKKLCIALIPILILSFFCSCKAQTRTEKAQRKAVEICESYLNFDISKEDAKNELNSVASSIESENISLGVEINYIAYLLTKPSVSMEDFQYHYEFLKNAKYD